MTPREAIVARARALIGVRFRPQGRSADYGLDCIGLAALAGGLEPAAAPRGYALRSAPADAGAAQFAARGFRPIAAAEARPGDLLVVQAGPAQLHAVLIVPGGYLHADAGLRRVAEVPGPVPWPVLAAWRFPGV